MHCEHPESSCIGIEPEFTWCSRCGALKDYNTWQHPEIGEIADDYVRSHCALEVIARRVTTSEPPPELLHEVEMVAANAMELYLRLEQHILGDEDVPGRSAGVQ